MTCGQQQIGAQTTLASAPPIRQRYVHGQAGLGIPIEGAGGDGANALWPFRLGGSIGLAEASRNGASACCWHNEHIWTRRSGIAARQAAGLSARGRRRQNLRRMWLSAEGRAHALRRPPYGEENREHLEDSMPDLRCFYDLDGWPLEPTFTMTTGDEYVIGTPHTISARRRRPSCRWSIANREVHQLEAPSEDTWDDGSMVRAVMGGYCHRHDTRPNGPYGGWACASRRDPGMAFSLERDVFDRRRARGRGERGGNVLTAGVTLTMPGATRRADQHGRAGDFVNGRLYRPFLSWPANSGHPVETTRTVGIVPCPFAIQ